MPNSIETRLTRLLKIRHPVLLAPMAGAAGGALASAVTHAGGMGLIASGYADEDVITAQMEKAGNARVGVGFITWSLATRPHALNVALAFNPAAIMMSFGDAAAYADAVRAAGALLICQVQTLAQAREALAWGADVLVAQGRDAGGHAGTVRGTMALVPAVADLAGDRPVVAAGGIADGRGLAAALALGASGVLLGSRFVATQESLWPDAMKAALIESKGDDTRQTGVFDVVRGLSWPEEFPGRVVQNVFFNEWVGREEDLRRARPRHEKAFLASPFDDPSIRPVWAGEGVDLVNDCPPAGQVIEVLIKEAIETIRGMSSLIVEGPERP